MSYVSMCLVVLCIQFPPTDTISCSLFIFDRTAARALFIECQGYFSKAEAATGDNHEIARQMVMTTLENTSNNVFSLPLRWVGLQQLSVDSVGSPLGRDLLLLTSSSICQGIGQALRYRQNESSSLYDIPSYDSSSPSSYISLPWTSSHEMLEVFFSQLQAIQQSGESILSVSLDYDTQKANLRQYVEDISASALSGHHDIVLHGPDSDEATKAYEETKLLAVPLLRQYANNSDENGDDDDLVALQTSLAHSFFEGIVQICHDHRKSWRYQGPFSDQEADKRYDIRPMMSNTSSDSPYGHLHQTRDYRTDLSFCGYVLRWYADRGHYPEGESRFLIANDNMIDLLSNAKYDTSDVSLFKLYRQCLNWAKIVLTI